MTKTAREDLHSIRIQSGDTVFVVTLEYGIETSQETIVVNTPAGAGDLWQFRRPDGSVFAINPYSPTFVCIEKRYDHV